MEQDFEWDDEKDAINRVKHGLGFSIAMRAFRDPDRVTRPDQRFDYGEARFITVGMIEGRLFVVVHTMRGRAIRLISARKANQRERMRHENRANAT